MFTNFELFFLLLPICMFLLTCLVLFIVWFRREIEKIWLISKIESCEPSPEIIAYGKTLEESNTEQLKEMIEKQIKIDKLWREKIRILRLRIELSIASVIKNLRKKWRNLEEKNKQLS